MNKFCYLGDMLSADGDADAAVEARIRIEWNKFRQLVPLLTNRDGIYRRLISKSAFMQFLAILTFLHSWNNESQGYLNMQGSWQFLQNKGSYCPLKSGTGAKNAVVI